MVWDFSVVWNNLNLFGRALWVTVELSALSILLGTGLGLILGVASLSRASLVNISARFVVELFLALPALVLIIWLYFCLPLLAPKILLSGFSASTFGLGLSLSGFVAQIARAGINNVPNAQLEVAYCLGMTRSQTIWHILIPQAFRKMLPPMMGQYITCYKFSTLASVVAVPELLHSGSNLIAITYRPLEIYTAIAVIFVITVLPMNYAASRFERTARFGGTEKI
jgi:polar amino acid transport system permease protein